MNVTLLLIAVNLAVFGLQLVAPGFTEAFALTPALATEGAGWQFVTYMFLHATHDIHGNLLITHILLNMFVLMVFGPGVERELGWKYFAALYFLAGLGSAGLHLMLAGDPLVRMLGASGAVFGVLAAYGFMFPRSIILVYFVPMPAVVAVVGITAFELFAGFVGFMPGIASFGHVGGILTGVVFMVAWKFLANKVPVVDREPRSYEYFWE